MVSPPEGHPREPEVDLEAYLARIGYSGPRDPSLATLKSLHLAHATSIPFENLDILLGREISLELEAIEAKLVAGRRGGYCFEHNSLFAAVLESLGFDVTRLAARVRFGSTVIRPLSHMLLSVKLDGQPWLADVGFGGEGLLYPLPILDSEPSRQFGWTFRVQSDGDFQVLQSLHADGWFDLYAFTQEPRYPIDFVVANHFTATYPHSPFVQSLVVQRQTCEKRFTLRNRELTEESPERKNIRTLPDDDALLATLAEVFGLSFPAGMRFRYREEVGHA
jgi:N-hydroxyarylamine O-acetyltransferase